MKKVLNGAIFFVCTLLAMTVFSATKFNDYHSDTDYSFQARVAQCWHTHYGDMAAFDYNIGNGKKRQDYKLCFGRFDSNTQRKKSCANNHIHIWMSGANLNASYKGNTDFEEYWMSRYRACIALINQGS